MANDWAVEKESLIDAGRDFHRRGWSLGTSSNYSIVVGRDPLRLLVTASGFDKGRLTPGQFVVVDAAGTIVEPGRLKPSAETLLHVILAQVAGAGAVLHTHSVFGTLLSEATVGRGYLEISGYEMLKGLSGVVTHETVVEVPVFPNTQDISHLAQQVAARRRSAPDGPPGFLIAGHGLYAWGCDFSEARRHIEVLEFLFEVIGRRASLGIPAAL